MCICILQPQHQILQARIRVTQFLNFLPISSIFLESTPITQKLTLFWSLTMSRLPDPMVNLIPSFLTLLAAFGTTDHSLKDPHAKLVSPYFPDGYFSYHQSLNTVGPQGSFLRPLFSIYISSLVILPHSFRNHPCS